MALRTVTPDHRHLQQISLYAPQHLPPHRALHEEPAHGTVGESDYRQWSELDHLFVQLWELHSIRLKVTYDASPGKEAEVTHSRLSSLLRGVRSRGVVDFVRQGW